jgi:hypothetical protein
MKTELQQQAKHLFFETGLNKSEIAEQLGVNRRTVMLWAQQGNWEQLKRSAQCMPSMLAEKCYYLIDHLLNTLLMQDTKRELTVKDADAISKLSSSIRRLKNRSATNEAMEMFNFFLEHLRKRDSALAVTIRPHLESYLETRKDVQVSDFMLEGFDAQGYKMFNPREL